MKIHHYDKADHLNFMSNINIIFFFLICLSPIRSHAQAQKYLIKIMPSFHKEVTVEVNFENSKLSIYPPKYIWSDTTDGFYFIDCDLTDVQIRELTSWITVLYNDERISMHRRDSTTRATGFEPPPFPSVDGILLKIDPGLQDPDNIDLIMNDDATLAIVTILQKHIGSSKELGLALNDCLKYVGKD